MFMRSDSRFCQKEPKLVSTREEVEMKRHTWNMACDKTLIQKYFFHLSNKHILKGGLSTLGSNSLSDGFSSSFRQKLSLLRGSGSVSLHPELQKCYDEIEGELENYRIPQTAASPLLYAAKKPAELAKDTSLKSKQYCQFPYCLHFVGFHWWVACLAEFAEIWVHHSSLKDLEGMSQPKCWDCAWPILSVLKHSELLKNKRS